MRVDAVVLAKAPAPGSSKTRLHPPCTYEEAAALAAAALDDTLVVIHRWSNGGRCVLALEGVMPRPVGWHLVPQRGNGLDERIAFAFEDVGVPALVVGMDTPQLTAGLLESAAALLVGADAVIGRSVDGGFWALGLREPDLATAVLGVPMSAPTTGSETRRRLEARGARVVELPKLRDVDTIADAWAVARAAPQTRFASTLRSFTFRRHAGKGGDLAEVAPA